MTPTITPERLEAAYQAALEALLKERHPEGYWVGELSTSALSTATAVMALWMAGKHQPDAREPEARARALIAGGLQWLADHQNDDGGWGDTTKSFSNIATTMLCRAAFYLTESVSRFELTVNRTEQWLFAKYGNTPAQLAEAVRARYGKDRTFAVPILTTCALAGLIPWSEVPPLPFELAIFPQSWFRLLRLHVVSYALPALIAIGQCIYHHKKPWNPFTRIIRALSRKRSLRVLERIQPSNGGFLEATPLTSFVVLSLAACGLAGHNVTRKGVDFIVNSVRHNGCWPIDTNLSTWVTTLSINALSAAAELDTLPKREKVRDWLLAQQFRERHPYTGSAPGGWSWTPLPGAVPDADDTPGALLAIGALGSPPFDVSKYYRDTAGYDPAYNVAAKNWVYAMANGIEWLVSLKNRDGGWPTFCRGWGTLPFDRSGNDLTAHALRAIHSWSERLGKALDADHDAAWERYGPDVTFWFDASSVFAYLSLTQRPDGAWLPLWFGNQHAPNDENPTYGTARVLAAYRDLGMMNEEPARRGVAWMLAAQNADGGWGGAPHTPSSMEETALAVEILVDAVRGEGIGARGEEVNKGLAWLVQQVEQGGLYNPSPIGFYFAKLWYYEKLYPIIFTVAALGRARCLLKQSLASASG
ncbi:MAG: squalene--hopene cyclase [Gemmataceae bacterium]|nr:squalene--hopene cyclase [Gemmataceae bacterium]